LAGPAGVSARIPWNKSFSGRLELLAPPNTYLTNPTGIMRYSRRGLLVRAACGSACHLEAPDPADLGRHDENIVARLSAGCIEDSEEPLKCIHEAERGFGLSRIP
jgi:hypothetical protein